MKKISYTILFFISTFVGLFINGGVVYADTQVSASVTDSQHWTLDGSPYLVQDAVIIKKGATVTIDPGVDVKFGGTAISILGNINANGTQAQPINFSAIDPAKDWKINFANSTSTFSYVNITGSTNPVYGINTNLKIDHLKTNLSGPLSFNLSTVDVSFSDFGNGGKAIEFYNNSAGTVHDSVFHDSAHKTGLLLAYASSTLNVQNVTFNNINQGAGIAVFNKSSATIASTTLENGVNQGICIYLYSSATIKDVKIKGFNEFGILEYSTSQVSLDRVVVTGNERGIGITTPSVLHATSTSVYGNKSYGIYNVSRVPVDATNIWWGDPTGPYNSTENPNGLGNAEGLAAVNFSPWLTEDPFLPKCCSNVAFIPGLEASRLYAPGMLSENQLWEPNRNADVEKLYMNASGTSMRNDVYTRDVIGDVGALFWKSDVYSGFIKYMDGLVSDKTIVAWKALPYDWRLGLGDVVNKGVENANGNVSYTTSLPDISYMILSLSKLSQTAKNGKVTLVTHSNGGLVAKVLIQKLQELKTQGKSDLIDHIDRIVMIASPQLGSADAIASILHGYKLNYLGGLILDEAHGRAMGENMPGAINLLPTKKYFDTIKEPIITFATSTDSLNNLSNFYNHSITDYATFEKFLSGADGRKKPVFSDTYTPNVLNKSLLTDAENQHNNIDNWQFPASIEVTQLAGWGAQTLKGIQYNKKTVCNNLVTSIVSSCKDVMAVNPSFTIEGDGTVLYPSALQSQGNQLYFDIKKYNNPEIGKKQNRSHSDILETTSVESLVKNILIGSTSTLPMYITTNKPTAKDGKLLVSITASTTLSAKDTLGNHTGVIVNPDQTSDIKVLEQNVPNSFYANFGDTQYIGLDADSPAKITFQGSGYGTFTFGSIVSQGDTPVSATTFTDIPVTPQMQGEVINATSSAPILALDVDGDGKVDATTTASQTFDPILYLEVMKKTIESFDLKKIPEKLLIMKIDQLEKLIKNGKIKNVERQIKSFTKNIDRRNCRLRKITNDERDQIVQMLTVLVESLK